MIKINNRGFFLIETLVVTTIVAMAMVFLYSQMTKLMDGYELRLTYNTVDGVYAATEFNQYIIDSSGTYDALTTGAGLTNISTYGFVEAGCSVFSDATYCANIYNALGITNAIITEYNTASIKTKAPNESTFSDDLKLFIKNIKKVSGAAATDFRLILSFADGSYSTIKLNSGVDTIAPVITGQAVLFVMNGDPYNVKDGLVATDNIYGDISDNIVCTLSAGSTYNCIAKDSSGNSSNTFVRTVTISNKPATYDVTGAVQTFTANVDGYYKIELWGAQGGTPSATTYEGGRGAYATGVIYLTAGTVLNVYVGGAGNAVAGSSATAGGFNGGGDGGKGTSYPGGSGGGATDIRLGGTALTNRILVAAGGGGGNYYSTYSSKGGYGGSTLGGNGTYTVGTYSGYGASQSAGGNGGTTATAGTAGTSGQGGNGGYYSTTYGAGAGGGGYFGGGGGAERRGGGGGGSSWYSPTAFSSMPSLIAGNAVMPDWAGTGTMTGNGNTSTTETAGYAKITFLSK